MDTWFVQVLNRSVSAVWLIGVVLLLHLALRRAPRWLICLLWAPAAVRLLCPVLPRSLFSLVPSTETLPAFYLTQQPPALTAQAQLLPVTNPLLPQTRPIPLTVSVDRVQIWALWGTFLWLAGLAVFALYTAVSLWRLHRRLRPALALGNGVWVCDDLSAPFLWGLLRPRIYLPSGLDAAQTACVLAHERAHLRRGDPLWKAVGFLALAVHWFNPLVWAAYRCFCADLELACDERALRGMDRAAAARYARALLDCSLGRRTFLLHPLAFGETDVKRRIRRLLQGKQPARWAALTAAAAIVLLAAGFLADPVLQGDRLQVVQAGPEASVQFALRLGTENGGGQLIAEQWAGGVCTASTPVTLPGATEQITLSLTPRRAGDGYTGADLQLETDTGGTLDTFFALPAHLTATGWYFSSYKQGETIPLTAGESRVLAVWAPDTGSGAPALDCAALSQGTQDPARAEYLILVRAVFTRESIPVSASAPAAS